MNPQIDHYLQEGCGRCPLGGTPDCKVHTWKKELVCLRKIMLSCGLEEELKWGVPCYTHRKKNILVLAAFKEYCSISFFKGVLLKDPHHLLQQAGENTQSARLIRFTQLKDIPQQEAILRSYIFEAIEIENAGLKPATKNIDEYPIPLELHQHFKEDPGLKEAFFSLTPGRQKGYLIYFSAPKQAKTRESRIQKYIPLILKGKGIHD